MNCTEFLAQSDIVLGAKVISKNALLEWLAQRAASKAGANSATIKASLEAREQLGSTGVGQGVAIPHARIDGLKKLYGVFVRLEKAIDFAAIDGAPVDLIFLLLTPIASGQEHLAALACISRRLRDPKVVRELRQTKSSDAAFEALTRA